MGAHLTSSTRPASGFEFSTKQQEIGDRKVRKELQVNREKIKRVAEAVQQ